MVKGKCIYCKKIKELNEEHAFPKALLQTCTVMDKCAPEWVIHKLCVGCNGKLSRLDDILVTKGPMAFIWKRIKSEWDSDDVNDDRVSMFYNASTYGIRPLNLFYPDPLYGGLIILHEETGSRTSSFHPTLLGRARVPQIVLIQYAEGQNAEQSIGENFEKWSSNEISVEESDECDGVHCIFGNTYVFAPEATKYFMGGTDKEREFVSKFMKKRDHMRFDLRALFPDNLGDAGKLNGFCTRLRASIKVEIGAKRFEPKESTENYVMVAADKKAIPYINRAIAKIAFHCFLYWHPQFSGHEPIFEEIRAFVLRNGNHQTSTGEDFMTRLNLPESYFWSSNEHFHIFRFYVHGDNIICQIVFFTGLWLDPCRGETPEPLAWEIILAGDSDRARLGSPEEIKFPFYVHGKSQLKRRILPILPSDDFGVKSEPKIIMNFGV